MTLLTICQDAADLVGMPRPTSVATSQNDGDRQFYSLANRAGLHISQRHDWTALQRDVTWQSVNDEVQGKIDVIAPGYRWHANESIWDRTNQEPIGGPLSPQRWQLNKASVFTGPYYDFRIFGGELHLYPTPPADRTMALDYVTRRWVLDKDGTDQERYADDQDETHLDENLMTLHVIWGWKSAKGMDYSEDFATFERELAHAIARDGGRRVLDANGRPFRTKVPGTRAPEGSWML